MATLSTHFIIGRTKEGTITLKVRPEDEFQVNQYFKKVELREKKTGTRQYVFGSLELPERKKTYKQLKAAWSLITVLFQLQEDNYRKPTPGEKESLYNDFLDEFGNYKKSKNC